MSEHYEVVLSCFLRDDTPAPVLAALRWHMGVDDDCPDAWDPDDHPYPLLLTGDHSRLPGGDTASLRRTVQEFTTSGERYEWELFARKDWVDDLVLHLDAFLRLIAPHVVSSGYGGHIRHVYETEVKPFTFHDGTYDPVGIRELA
ncbi:hypothetical protein ACH5AO_31065 [Streptomyces sp. NPDC018964]|uniref:hypothetical protein n=1 Tax=unclassified Streptomyces TaxID=2593676 RepID=UPI0037B39869